MKTINWVFLIALTVIAAGCSSSQPFEALTEEVAPVDAAMPSEVQPEVAAPAPQADADDTAVVPEDVAPVVAEELPSARLSGAIKLREGIKVQIPQDLIEKVGSGAEEYLINTRPAYSAIRPDLKIKVTEDDREEVEYVINLTPEQTQELFQKHAGTALKQFPLEKLNCLLSGQSSADCED